MKPSFQLDVVLFSCAFFLYPLLSACALSLVPRSLPLPGSRLAEKNCSSGTPNDGERSFCGGGWIGSLRRTVCTRRRAIYSQACVPASLQNKFCTTNLVATHAPVAPSATTG